MSIASRIFGLTRIAVLAPVMMLCADVTRAAEAKPPGDNFYQSSAVRTEQVRFRNIYGMEVAGTLFTPKDVTPTQKRAALVVGHPFRAVRQQAANLYATKMAEAGFVTLSFDQSYWGESEGQPRGAVLPDVYTENFSAAIDFLGTRSSVDPTKIGIIGICASGGFSIAAAKIDPRVKALATVGMYDMGSFFRTGLNHGLSVTDRNSVLEAAAARRYGDFQSGSTSYPTGHGGSLSAEALDSNDFYETPRGKVPSNNRLVTQTSYPTLMNFHPFQDIASISPRPILFVVGDAAPSRHFTDEAYALAGPAKELYEVAGATRIDLYDRVGMIPWDKLTTFFSRNL